MLSDNSEPKQTSWWGPGHDRLPGHLRREAGRASLGRWAPSSGRQETPVRRSMVGLKVLRWECQAPKNRHGQIRSALNFSCFIALW